MIDMSLFIRSSEYHAVCCLLSTSCRGL